MRQPECECVRVSVCVYLKYRAALCLVNVLLNDGVYIFFLCCFVLFLVTMISFWFFCCFNFCCFCFVFRFFVFVRYYIRSFFWKKKKKFEEGTKKETSLAATTQRNHIFLYASILLVIRFLIRTRKRSKQTLHQCAFGCALRMREKSASEQKPSPFLVQFSMQHCSCHQCIFYLLFTFF